MVSADEDITTELDRVVCRLMKLALRTSKGRKNAMPTKWLHCKLFDLLTLTEKTIERRRQHFVENYAFKAIGFGDEGQEISALLKFKEDKAGLDLMDKYHHLVEVDKTETIEDKDLLYDDNISLPSEDIKGNELMTTRMSLLHPSWLQWRRKHSKNLERTEAWVNRETLFKHFNSMKHNFPVSDIDIEQSISNGSYNHRRKSNRKIKSGIKYCTHLKKSSCTKRRSRHKTVQKEGNRHKHNKKTLHRKSSHFTKGSIVKVSAANVRNFKIRKCEINSSFLHSTKSKPIPGSLIKLCSPQYNQFKILRKHSPTISDISKRETEVKVSEINENLDSNEESNSKVTDGQELSLKVFAPQLSLSKMAENVMETKPSLQDTTPKDTIDEPLDIRLQSNNRSQTIFLYDINEPSTSKGVRHVSMDVQCGPDTSYEKINHVAVTSCSDICTGVEMRNPPSNSANNSTDFGTSMNKDEKIYRTLIPRIKSIGIKIRDSDVRFSDNNRSTITDKMSDVTTSTILPNTNAYDSTTETDTVNLSTESSNFNKQIMNNKSNSTFPKILSILHDAPENIKTYLSSPPKTLETNIANCLISRLKLCYSGIRIRSFKSKKEFQEAFPEKTLQATTNVNKLKTFTVQKKKEGNIKTLKRDSKFKLARTKSYTKEIKRRVETEKKILQTDKPNLQSKSIPNENKGSKKGIQIRNPKLTMVKPKLSNETSNKKHIPVSQSSSLRSRQSNEKKVQSKKGTSSDLKNKPKHMCATWSSKDFMDKKNESKVSLKTIPPPKYLIDNNKNRIMMNHLNKSFDSIKRYSRTSHIPVLKRSKTEEMKINLAKMQPNVFSEYYVYRNETKNSLKASEVEKDTTVRSSSPQSIQSSTCSSPASVQTVKLRPKSVSPNSHSKMRTISPDSKSISSIKSKKSLKIGKRISEVKSDENKENNIDCKHSTENEKNKVFIAKLNCTPLQSNENSLVKRKSSKSVRIPDFTDDKKEPFVVKNHSSKSICNKNVEHDDIAISDQDITFVMHDTSCLIYPRSSTPVNEEDNDGYKFRQMIENSIKSGQILDVVTSLVDDIIEKNIISDNSNIGVGALNVNLEHDDYKSNRFEDTLSSSFGSCKTAIENLDIIKEHDDEEDSNTTANTVIAHNISLNTSHIVPEVEVLPGMKYSTTSDSPQGAAVKNNCSLSPVTFAKESVLDLFERKNTLAPPVNASPLALQAFSGFSVNTEPVPGDQPDYVNQIDSETGSGANDVNRQATSEELFVSGRSSVMYESCLIEEDTVVPEWLFQIINQQQIESEETSELRPAMLPVSEPMYDVNGSNVETVGNEAGAGDGRGVHSDVSQDSSGQGSSITSSDTSSAPQSEVSCTGVSTIQSEAVLIDPTVLAGQYAPPLPNPVNSDSFRSTQESSDNTDPPRTSREVHHDTMALLGASDADADADESSLDTDAD